MNVFSQQKDLLQIDYNYINSSPQNSEVYLNGDYIGSTPLRFYNNVVDTVNTNNVVIKHKNYFDFTFTFEKADIPLNKNISLVQVNKSVIDNQIVQKNKLNLFNSPRQVLPVAVSGILTVGSAILSFYFKRQANDRYDEYLITGDPNTLNKTKKYDLYSGIGLGVFEVSFVSLLYFLLIK